ncbi:37S ribosomal protein S18, mitochondrial [Trametes pubescens]|uniref:37S ribosomal protein S18, mitochondrial n=1 Tax=Trametes pubescens TaxID=154538 RepID=A0A1M2VSF4_TRAPU|nr:37S ribosomal protein S18, mitochondrial [Trametes pubescens]
MSLLRTLPALRSRAAHRAWAAPFSSSASTSASAANTTPGVQDIFDALGESTSTPSPASTSTIQSFTRQIGAAEEQQEPAQEQEDGPPLPSEDSFPLGVNPAAAANAVVAKGRAGTKKPLYAVSVKATRNNTIVTFARPKGLQLVTLTGGKLGFKKSNRNGYEAGYQCAVGIIGAMEKELERTAFEWELNLKGFGQGRDAMLTAITTAVGENVKPLLTRVTDRTPLKIGGTRSQKARRI